MSTTPELTTLNELKYVPYESELQLPSMVSLIEKDLSEPYSVYTYRYFIHQWPNLCFLTMDEDKCVGVVICKLDAHKNILRGYIAMLAVAKEYRKRKIGTFDFSLLFFFILLLIWSLGTTLVQMAINAMKEQNADEVF
ncbi:N-alpha-acetyltransferase 30, variant 2 [Basidiobolus ranarum]|uniref:N-alpha-acetyltransferase 30, variant 2 n=1 Tax=Basidiobolus ranarum TaxID=34480 RepID=A0ABR2W6V5_9FUNG